MSELFERINIIKGVDKKKVESVQTRFDKLAKPLRGLGILEELICKIGGIDDSLDISKRCVVVACADNGIVE
ncbi:MAG: nicotinate-nucleotide--dimethylbenzimidazole phosphoribosyltransferase, partial [Clostridia bacterium]